MSLLMRHWNSIACILEKGKFSVLLFQDEEGTVYGNDWARRFMRGVSFHHAAWQELFVDGLRSQPNLLLPV